MLKFRLTKEAIKDFKEIGRYTQMEWGRSQRDLYLSKLDACFHMIAHEPGIGKSCDDIKPGYRKYHYGRHLIFYKQSLKCIDIVRFLHDQMDKAASLFKNSGFVFLFLYIHNILCIKRRVELISGIHCFCYELVELGRKKSNLTVVEF